LRHEAKAEFFGTPKANPGVHHFFWGIGGAVGGGFTVAVEPPAHSEQLIFPPGESVMKRWPVRVLAMS